MVEHHRSLSGDGGLSWRCSIACFDHVFNVRPWRRTEIWTHNTGVTHFEYISELPSVVKAAALHYHNRTGTLAQYRIDITIGLLCASGRQALTRLHLPDLARSQLKSLIASSDANG